MHRTANINEKSARYSVLDKEFYIPDSDQIMSQSVKNNQGRDGNLSEGDAERITMAMIHSHVSSDQVYDYLLGLSPLVGDNGTQHGVARELARTVTSVGKYTTWFWKTDLRNLLGFMSLRCDSHAQYEIRAYADVISDVVKAWVPFSHRAWSDYDFNAYNISAQALGAVRAALLLPGVDTEVLINSVRYSMEIRGSSVREIDEVIDRLFPNL